MDPKDIALRFNEYINARNQEALMEIMTDDHVFIDTAGNRVEGKEANGENWTRFFREFPNYRNVFESVETQGNLVRMRGYSLCSDERLNRVKAVWTAGIREDKLSLWQVEHLSD